MAGQRQQMRNARKSIPESNRENIRNQINGTTASRSIQTVNDRRALPRTGNVAEQIDRNRNRRVTNQVVRENELRAPNSGLNNQINRARPSATNQVVRKNELREPNRSLNTQINKQRTRKALEDAFRRQRNKK